MVAVSIAQGGSGLPCLSPNTYANLSGQEIACTPPISLEVPDSCMLTKVIIINNVRSLFYKFYASLQLENDVDVAQI